MMKTFFFITPNGTKGVVFAEYGFEAESYVKDYFRMDSNGIELKEIENLEELRECVDKQEVISFL